MSFSAWSTVQYKQRRQSTSGHGQTGSSILGDAPSYLTYYSPQPFRRTGSESGSGIFNYSNSRSMSHQRSRSVSNGTSGSSQKPEIHAFFQPRPKPNYLKFMDGRVIEIDSAIPVSRFPEKLSSNLIG